MPQEPWKRAYQLGRIVPPVRREGPRPRQGNPAAAIAIALLTTVALGAAAWFYWPQMQLALLHSGTPVAIPAAKPSPGSPAGRPNRVDVASLDSGLDIDLTIMGSYLDLLAAARGWNVPWKVTATGPSTLRLSAPGVDVGVRDNLIESYTIELFKVFDDDNECWKPWRKTLLCTHIAPDQTYRGVTGLEDSASHFDIEGFKPIHAADGWVHPAYQLLFSGGKLTSLKGGLSFGPAEHAPAADTPAAGVPHG